MHHAEYLQVWIDQPALACEMFSKHRLIEVPNLRFIDKYPRVTEALQDDDGRSIHRCCRRSKLRSIALSRSIRP